MNIRKGSHLQLLICPLGAIAAITASNSELLALTPTPATNIPQAVPSIDNSNPQTLDSSQLNLLNAKIQNLETQVNSLASQANSPPIIPSLFSGLAGAVLGSIITGLLLRKIPFLSERSQQQAERNEQLSADRDATTQYLNATISHLSTTVKNVSERVKGLETELSSLKISSKNDPDIAAVDFPTYNPDIYLHEREMLSQDMGDRSPMTELVAIYNSDPDSLLFQGIEVAETAESLGNRSLSGNQLVVLENKRNGSYLIVKKKRIPYLVPKPNLPINEDNYSLLESLFECRNYAANCSDFRLVQPAKVLAILGGVNWSLEQKGILEFF